MIRFTLLLLALCLAWSSHAQQREQRVALVIGNAAYPSAPLRNPVNDAKDMADKLRGLGFVVIERSNLGIKQIGSTLREFRAKLVPGGVALVYYAGHGLQIKGENYLPAVDAEIAGEEDVSNQSLAIRQIMDVLTDAKTRLNLVFLDACRNNPYARTFRNANEGLSKVAAPSGTLISFATRPGSVAADGVGRNGLYTGALLQQMGNPNQSIEQVLKRVVTAVKAGSKNQQEPWMEGSIEGEFCFGDCARANQPPVVVAQGNAGGADQLFWESVKDTKDVNELKAYLNKFPGGLFAELAGIRLRGLEQAAADRIAAEAAQRAALERAAAEAGVKEQQRLAMEAQAKEQQRLALLAQEQERTAREAAAKEQARLALLAQEQARVAAEAAQKLAAARLAALPQPGPTIKDCADCPEMVVIPAGSFDMGSNDNTDERPVHRANVPSFLIGKTEVTQGQWRAVMGSNPSLFSSCGDDCPVERVAWNQAQEFVQRLSQKTGKQYRLPSEAEWEYAARAGSSTKWSSGDAEYQLVDYAWYSGNSQNRTQRVAQKRPNAFGVYDMHGNVWEWTQDCWHDNYSGAPTDGSAWTTGCSVYPGYTGQNGRSGPKVFRGGSWNNSPLFLRSADRNWFTPGFRIDYIGLRLARTP